MNTTQNFFRRRLQQPGLQKGRVLPKAYRALLTLLLTLTLLACIKSLAEERQRFITRDGLEPDRWASVWLVKTFIDSDAEVLIYPQGASLRGGIRFAVPESPYRRGKNTTAFASLMQGYDIADPGLERMRQIIHAIETLSWGISGTEADAVEQAFRRLQERYGRYDVPVTCYMDFFNRLYRHLQRVDQDLNTRVLAHVTSCDDSVVVADVRHERAAWVSLIPIEQLLEKIRAGKNVVFVDAREEAEFHEVHIPGAIRLQLRDVASADLKIFAEADHVISYCIKDFRGYEVARALAERGVKNVSTMKPHGLSGWKSLGLPVVMPGDDETQKQQQLLHSRLASGAG
ncbi:MAG TPA: hypothetical protein ENJ24_05420 [Gammaproteobacteria bacterium]|nr:hypothetical protein [Gammaproteobacteria bacterium]